MYPSETILLSAPCLLACLTSHLIRTRSYRYPRPSNPSVHAYKIPQRFRPSPSFAPVMLFIRMPILFCTVARGTTVLAKYAGCAGNFTEDYERAKAFSFLSEIKRKFQMQYGVRAQTALPYAMNSEFSRTMATQMRLSTEPSAGASADKVQAVQGQVDELKGIMVRNIGYPVFHRNGRMWRIQVAELYGEKAHPSPLNFPLEGAGA
ncbi:VAMP7-like protein [Mya arenaria]|uniref:VAMP7-like protein n=1 Tax=Mya arenaria TaxID=6604 RepID=A0ABY7DMW5_MYAAR|nr:VAMP7-like protein [Mya arenaria]